MIEFNEQRIDRILEKLKQVRDKGLSCFGSDSHKFRLNSTIDESTLQLFESEHGVILPADYRFFLRMAGNGGAGPYYGIYKLDKWNDFLDWVTDEPPQDVLALPCPLHPMMSRDADWKAQFDNCLSPYQGMITIGSQGCSYVMGLIVTGEFAGRVVYLDADGQSPYVVRETDFLAWYERWLDELLGGYDMFWFGFGIGGDEASLTALLNDGATPVSERAEAVYAIRRLPDLSAEGRRLICHLISDNNSEVRAAACAVVENFEIYEAVDSLPKLLHDESAEVQKAAISANMKLRNDTVSGEVTHLLDSDDEEVATRAFFRLKDYGHLSRKTLLRLVESSPHGGLRHYAANVIEWKPKDEGLLIRLLTDEHPLVRFYATLGLRKIGSRSALDAVIDLLNHEPEANTIDSILRMLGEVTGDTNAEILLEWTKIDDDLHRLTAVDSLCKIGDIRVAPVVKDLLMETRSPERVDTNGFSVAGNVKSIRDLVQESLRASPNRELRRLGSC